MRRMRPHMRRMRPSTPPSLTPLAAAAGEGEEGEGGARLNKGSKKNIEEGAGKAGERRCRGWEKMLVGMGLSGVGGGSWGCQRLRHLKGMCCILGMCFCVLLSNVVLYMLCARVGPVCHVYAI